MTVNDLSLSTKSPLKCRPVGIFFLAASDSWSKLTFQGRHPEEPLNFHLKTTGELVSEPKDCSSPTPYVLGGPSARYKVVEEVPSELLIRRGFRCGVEVGKKG